MTPHVLIVLAVLTAAPPQLDEIVASELERSMAVLAEQEEPPHYIAVAVTDNWTSSVSATAGTIRHSDDDRYRYLDVDVRVGTPELDNTHPLRGQSNYRRRDRSRVLFPLDEQPEHALRHAVWQELDARYREAAEAVVMVRANQTVKVEEEDPAPDFGPREPIQDQVPVAAFDFDRMAWEPILTALSSRLDASPRIHESWASIRASREITTFVDTEGTRLSHGTTRVRVSLSASATAEDGDEVSADRHMDVHLPDRLPDAATLEAWADEVVAELEGLLDAPRGKPYSGPVLLRGKAAAVFFHEVMGHRLEGHRQKRESEGKTFKEYVGRSILPEFIDVVDDPTLAHAAGHDLNGFYAYDDEGVAAQRVQLVEDGVLMGFLMGRSPIQGFGHSNGHGRRSVGRSPVSRMGNLVIEVENGRPYERLRAQLIESVRKQDLEYGLIVGEIDGGFTMTGRRFPNSFNVRAATSWRVYADGRPDELIRGIDLVGTPLEAFSSIVAGGDDPDVFNGFCGAESGMVPVGGVSPSILFSSLEFQLKDKGSDRPPLLDKPGADPDGEVREEGGAP